MLTRPREDFLLLVFFLFYSYCCHSFRTLLAALYYMLLRLFFNLQFFFSRCSCRALASTLSTPSYLFLFSFFFFAAYFYCNIAISTQCAMMLKKKINKYTPAAVTATIITTTTKYVAQQSVSEKRYGHALLIGLDYCLMSWKRIIKSVLSEYGTQNKKKE